MAGIKAGHHDDTAGLGPAELDDHLPAPLVRGGPPRADPWQPSFGAIWSTRRQRVREAENGYMPSHDGTAHAERLLRRKPAPRSGLTCWRKPRIYSSAEPSAMCAGAITGRHRRVVYGLSELACAAVTGNHPENPTLDLPARGVKGGQRHRGGGAAARR